MVNNSKEQSDDPQDESNFVELPEDRLEQLEHIETDEPENARTENPGRKSAADYKPRQTPVLQEASKAVSGKPEPSMEDLLADIRQTLVEEAVVEPKGFFGRLRKRLNKGSETEEMGTDSQTQFDSMLEPREDLQKLVVEPKERKREPSKKKDEEKALQEFFADLEALADIEIEEYVPPILAPQTDLPVKRQEDDKAQLPKFPVKSRVEADVDFNAVREAVLKEYDDTKIEVEERKPQLQEEIRQTIRELKPIERFLLLGAGILTVLLLLSSGIYLIVRSISIPTPTPPAELDLANIVHPTRLTLPGGWEFNLGQGQVVDGEWRPQRAEWLVGTEISRWVALPWSLQLEAVLRTLKPEDQLELSMSNYEVLPFNVYSIREMTMGQLLDTDPKTPGLLVVLYNREETDGKYWVVEARP